MIETPAGKPYACNPGSPERVNFGEENYAKGYYLVTFANGEFTPEFRTTSPRPMFVETIDLNGAESADQALALFREQVAAKVDTCCDERKPLLELKLIGRVGFHPFELGRERLKLALEEWIDPLHVEIKNHLSLVSSAGEGASASKSLEEIELEVLHELIKAGSDYQGREEELVKLSILLRDAVKKGDVDGEELLALLDVKGG